MACGEICTYWFSMITKSLTAIFGILSTLIVLQLCSNHVKHFTNPLFQRKIIGKKNPLKKIVIIFIIPFYSINSMITTLVVDNHYSSEILGIVRAMYEAILIVSFFQLVVAYLCFQQEDGVKIQRIYNVILEKEKFKICFPFSLVMKDVEVKR
jgi:hypothetical protein